MLQEDVSEPDKIIQELTIVSLCLQVILKTYKAVFLSRLVLQATLSGADSSMRCIDSS